MLEAMGRPRSVLLCVLIALTPAVAVRGELVLTNYTAARPLQVMAAGDSITDDCVFNGAWRLYLQPLLETNGYAFTFVGRQHSTPVGSFTQTAHEGYCGAVVAAPGVLSYAVHGYSGTNVYLERIIPDALTNITPDLVLVLIGVNDIGHGRDPWFTATNDMSKLLRLIFSNAPGAQVILSKVTSISRASDVSGLDYSLYAANVPVYNAALQQAVNQRRAAGQNVCLADMFSAVSTTAMFGSDGLHPNALGLQAVAQEWLTRIQSISSSSNLAVTLLVKGGDTWKYSDAGLDLGTNWVRPDYDDGAWSNGPARLGYGEEADATIVNYGPTATNKIPTTYFRRVFVPPANVTCTNLVLRLAQAPAAVVWLNGQEIWRTNLPAGPIVFTNLALIPPQSLDGPYLFNPIGIDASQLSPGTNVLAVELHQYSASYGRIGFDLELIGTGLPSVPPVLSLTLAGTNLVFAWPAASGGGFGLYASTNLVFNQWFPAGVTVQTSGSQLVATQVVGAAMECFQLQKH
jgi:lysophospholipase L1-like esterase